MLVVSQFTLIADTAKETDRASPGLRLPTTPSNCTSQFCAALREPGVRVETGRFGARMAVGFVNDGPVTIVL